MLRRFAPLLIVIILLVSCGQQETAQHAASQSGSDSSRIEAKPGTPPLEQPTSFDDGELFFEAVAAGDLEICAQITNAQLRQKCVDDIRAL